MVATPRKSAATSAPTDDAAPDATATAPEPTKMTVDNATNVSLSGDMFQFPTQRKSRNGTDAFAELIATAAKKRAEDPKSFMVVDLSAHDEETEAGAAEVARYAQSLRNVANKAGYGLVWRSVPTSVREDWSKAAGTPVTHAWQLGDKRARRTNAAVTTSTATDAPAAS